MVSSSSLEVTTSNESPILMTVLATGTMTCPLRQMREMMNLRWVISAICTIDLSAMAGFMAINCAMYVWSSSVRGFDSKSQGFTKHLRMNIMASMTPTTPSG